VIKVKDHLFLLVEGEGFLVFGERLLVLGERLLLERLILDELWGKT
jgi:hypothetical protein